MKALQEYLDHYDRLMTLKNYSTCTRKMYLAAVRRFWGWCTEQQARQPGFDKKQAALLYLSERMKTKLFTTVNTEYSGLKMFFVGVLEREWNMSKLPRPRIEKRLPVILAKEEVEAIISLAGSFRNQLILTLIYATGLRLGELSRLRLEDINSKNMTIHVHNGKGAKDRILPLAEDMLPLLRQYYVQYRPVIFLFNGLSNVEPLSKRMIQVIMTQACKAAGIRRKASVHTLRHCYATHIYQDGANGLALQLMLGHKNFKTTTHYIHLSGDHYRGIVHPAKELCKRLSDQHLGKASETNPFL